MFPSLPNRDIHRAYIREIGRVLKSNGLFKVHAPVHYGVARRYGVPLPHVALRFIPSWGWRAINLTKTRNRPHRLVVLRHGAGLTKGEYIREATAAGLRTHNLDESWRGWVVGDKPDR